MDKEEELNRCCFNCIFCGDEGFVMTYNSEWIECIFCNETSEEDSDIDYEPDSDYDSDSDSDYDSDSDSD